MGFLQKTLQWLSGREKESEVQDRDARRQRLRAMARAVALASMADGQRSSQEILVARLERARLPVLSQLKDSAFEALTIEALSKRDSEGEEASLRFIAETITDPQERARTFALAVAITLADREIQDEEKGLLERLKGALEISDEDANEMIEELRKDQEIGNRK